MGGNDPNIIAKTATACLVSVKTDFEEATEYQLFVRCLSDQTVVEKWKTSFENQGRRNYEFIRIKNPLTRMPPTATNPKLTEAMPPT